MNKRSLLLAALEIERYRIKTSKDLLSARHQWFTSIILATQEGRDQED
jgi:hypothetical protein